MLLRFLLANKLFNFKYLTLFFKELYLLKGFNRNQFNVGPVFPAKLHLTDIKNLF